MKKNYSSDDTGFSQDIKNPNKNGRRLLTLGLTSLLGAFSLFGIERSFAQESSRIWLERDGKVVRVHYYDSEDEFGYGGERRIITQIDPNKIVDVGTLEGRVTVYPDESLDLDERRKSARFTVKEIDLLPDLHLLRYINTRGDYVRAEKRTFFSVEDREEFRVKGFDITEKLPRDYFELGKFSFDSTIGPVFDNVFRTRDGHYIAEENEHFYLIGRDGRLLTEDAVFLLKKEDHIIVGNHLYLQKIVFYENEGIDVKTVREIVETYREEHKSGKRLNVLYDPELRKKYDIDSLSLAEEVLDGKFELREGGVYLRFRNSKEQK